MLRSSILLVALSLALPAAAQIQTVDPNRAGDYRATGQQQQQQVPYDRDDRDQADTPAPGFDGQPYQPGGEPPASARERQDDRFDARRVPVTQTATVPAGEVLTAAEGVFGRGARGLARMIENVLRDQGEPVAYIAGQEAGGAFVFGLRYGSGTMHHRIEGQRRVYWTGPSVGFDVGGNADKVFVLVYNLHDSQRLFRRFPQAEGNVHFVGGFAAQYLRRGDIVLIPIRLGVGWRLGANAGYMRFSERSRWLPF